MPGLRRHSVILVALKNNAHHEYFVAGRITQTDSRFGLAEN
jgi:hypothetical protein